MPVKQWEHFRVNPPPPPVSIEACHDVQKAFLYFSYVHVFVFVNFGKGSQKKGEDFWSLSTKDRHASCASSLDRTWASDATWAANPSPAKMIGMMIGECMHALDQARPSA